MVCVTPLPLCRRREQKEHWQWIHTFGLTSHNELYFITLPTFHLGTTTQKGQRIICFSKFWQEAQQFQKGSTTAPMAQSLSITMQRNPRAPQPSGPDLFQTNNNLGCSIADRQQYIHDVLETHLLNEVNYKHLPPEIAKKSATYMVSSTTICYPQKLSKPISNGPCQRITSPRHKSPKCLTFIKCIKKMWSHILSSALLTVFQNCSASMWTTTG